VNEQLNPGYVSSSLFWILACIILPWLKGIHPRIQMVPSTELFPFVNLFNNFFFLNLAASEVDVLNLVTYQISDIETIVALKI